MLLLTKSSPLSLCTSAFLCLSGNYCTGGGAVVTCPAGSQCPAGSGGPSSCPAGYYQTSSGQSGCNGCPTGTIRIEWNKAATRQRKGSTGSVEGSKQCSGRAAHPSRCCLFVIFLPLGSYCTGGAAIATCAAGTYGASANLGSQAACTSCPAGQIHSTAQYAA